MLFKGLQARPAIPFISADLMEIRRGTPLEARLVKKVQTGTGGNLDSSYGVAYDPANRIIFVTMANAHQASFSSLYAERIVDVLFVKIGGVFFVSEQTHHSRVFILQSEVGMAMVATTIQYFIPFR